MRKQVQITMELFMDLLRIHCLGDESISEVRIQKALEEKLDALIRHDHYTTYKTPDDPAEREKARQAYLDAAGIHPDFRWQSEDVLP